MGVREQVEVPLELMHRDVVGDAIGNIWQGWEGLVEAQRTHRGGGPATVHN